MKKKGIQLGEAFGAVLTIVLVAMIVIVGIYMFSILRTTMPLQTGTTTNDTLTMVGPTVTRVANASLCRISDITVSSVYNASGTLINSGNYTVNGTGLANTTGTYPTTWYVSYTYPWGGEACEASDTMMTQFGTYPALIGLVGTIIFLAIVIGVLVSSFVFRTKRGA